MRWAGHGEPCAMRGGGTRQGRGREEYTDLCGVGGGGGWARVVASCMILLIWSIS